MANPRRLFLIDAVGAALTASLLLFVLGPFEQFFGMPMTVVEWLAGIAAVFAVYSLACFALFPSRWSIFLRIIASANTAYCFLTLTLALIHQTTLTVLGWAYFVGEVLIVISLVRYEVKATK